MDCRADTVSHAAPPRPSGWRLSEPEPPRATVLPFAPGIRRIVAPNPSAMTYHGTNTWLIDGPDGVVVLDPGSEDLAHLDAIEAEAARAGGVATILLSHTHGDHLGGTAALQSRTGAPIAGYRISADADFTADIALDEGARIGSLTALFTPGHAMDHLCFAHPGGVLFTGDHIMGWSTSVVPHAPYGHLGTYLRELARMRDHGATTMLSGHGPAITEPVRLTQTLIDHRLAREAQILSLFSPEPIAFTALFARAYPRIGTALSRPARANLMGHVEKLADDGRVISNDPAALPTDQRRWSLA